MDLVIPEKSLVVLIGPSGSGKSTFARTHFLPTEVLSSDFFRGLVSDDENNQRASNDAFDVLHTVLRKRLQRGRITVVDATNVQVEARKALLEVAREHHVLATAVVLNVSEQICHARNSTRPDRQFGSHVVRRQKQELRRSLRGLQREGFRHVYVLSSPEEIEDVTIQRTRLWTNREDELAPFDIIGDIHGCCDELEALLEKLGYTVTEETPRNGLSGGKTYAHPDGRRAVFLGDLVDRGPRVLDVLRIVRNMVQAGTALCVPGNHDVKFVRYLNGRKVQVTHGLQQTIAELEALDADTRTQVEAEAKDFLDSLISHFVLDQGRLVVAHAGMREEMQGRASGRVREFALYGETTGETDEWGLPVRYNWAAEYRGQAHVVYGHTPVEQPEWVNRTVNIDTGCVFGGHLTALRYPELETVSVPAARVYADPVRPFQSDTVSTAGLTAQQELDEVLDLEDVTGKRIINTRLKPSITLREEQTIAALEVMGRFGANPKWLIYLPPTMSPPETSTLPDFLEHPDQAFDYYVKEGVSQVVCEEKHMGSRAVVVVCRDAEAAKQRFGVTDGAIGTVYTRTGRPFFEHAPRETELLERVQTALQQSGFWDELQTDWVCLDCELMPWSAKAQSLLQQQYAPTGAAARSALQTTLAALRQASDRGLEIDTLLQRFDARGQRAEQYVAAYRRYCWSVQSVDDLKLAPFHILATEGAVHTNRDHVWHMETLRRITEADESDLLLATPYREVNVTDPEDRQSAIDWWLQLTTNGGEGMVVKPREFLSSGRRGVVQPALKCRGREYLRIIYGPEYDAPEHLERLKERSVRGKRSLALREFALGLEALERFIRREPLRRVHECVFGVLALETEPVDPRL